MAVAQEQEMKAKVQERLKKGAKISKNLDLTTDLPKETNELKKQSKKDQLMSNFKKLTQRKKSNK